MNKLKQNKNFFSNLFKLEQKLFVLYVPCFFERVTGKVVKQKVDMLALLHGKHIIEAINVGISFVGQYYRHDSHLSLSV